MKAIKYAVRYTRSFRHYVEVDEVIFQFSSNQRGHEDELINLITTILMDDQRAIVDFSNYDGDENEVVTIANMIKQEHSNMTIIWDFFKKDDIQLFKDNNIPFIFYPFAADRETAYAMAELGASDIYIVEDLAFDIMNLQFLKTKGVKIRVFPDIAQHKRGTQGIIPEITKFWIRPEDVNLYSDYIDVLEIFHQDDRTSVVYEIYQRKQWLGDIKDLILDFHDELPNTGIAPHFGQVRLNCCKKCMIGQCNLCMNINDLAKAFNQAGVEVIKKKEKNNIPEEQKQQLIKAMKERGKDILESKTN